ncbi:MAG: hypothetical protein ACYC0V_04130, partial [Armatimonadota bacterium]
MSWVKQNKLKSLVVAVILVVAVTIFIFSSKHRQSAEETAHYIQPVDVRATSVRNMESPILRESPGTVRPKTESDVAAKIMSTVSTVYVREGDHVSVGQILIRLEAS